MALLLLLLRPLLLPGLCLLLWLGRLRLRLCLHCAGVGAAATGGSPNSIATALPLAQRWCHLGTLRSQPPRLGQSKACFCWRQGCCRWVAAALP